jgi:lysophospholipase L1-like esterase
MHVYTRTRWHLLALIAAICLTGVVSPASLYASGDTLRVVILGSSTAVGANANPLSESWASRFTATMQMLSPEAQVTNLAVGGYTTFNIMPTGNVPPGIWDQPAFYAGSGHNISAAIALAPDFIIINLPTNDCVLLVPVELQIANYATIVATAAAAGVPVWITTPQPRNTSASGRLLLQQMVGLTNEAFAGRSMDFWTGFGDSTGILLPAYDSDGVHMNNAGHAVLYDRVMTTVTTTTPAMPSVAMHPRARTVTQNDSVSFQVIGLGSGPVTYQWQRNGSDIAGETGYRLQIAQAALADSGALFRCIITAGGADTASNEARLTVHASPDPPSTLIVSDDFSSGLLDTTVWTFNNPKDDATIGFAGTGTADVQLTIDIPGGTAHDAWTGSNDAPRVLQPFANQDFEIEAKFGSVPSRKYQFQGLMVQKDSANYVRFDVVQQGTRAHIFAATFTDGQPTVQQDSILSGTSPQYLRLKRTGARWTGLFSFDGASWKVATSFSYSTVTTAGGVFAGNAGDTPSASPAFTAAVDYFFNTASPLDPEDAPAAPALIAPVTGSTNETAQVALQWTSTGDSEDSVLIAATPTAWDTPVVAASVPSESGSLHLDGLMPGATYYWKVRCFRSGVSSSWSPVWHFTTLPAQVTLRAAMAAPSSIFTPDSLWADSSSVAANDWAYGVAKDVPLIVRSNMAVTFGVCSLAVRWSPAHFAWNGLDLTGTVWSSASTRTVSIDTLAGTATLTAAFPDTVTLLPSGVLLHARLAMKRAGRSSVTLDQIRFQKQSGSTTLTGSGRADTLTALILLGDVASAGGVMGRADGRVNFEDLSIWSLSYWSARTDTGNTAGRYRRKFDMGPTTDGTPYSLPEPDGTIGFEDLMIMGLMYGTTESTVVPKSARSDGATISVEAGSGVPDGNGIAVPVTLRGDDADLHGLAIRIPGAAERFVALTPGALLASLNPSPLMFVRNRSGEIEIHIAALSGAGRSIPVNGELFTVRLTSTGPVVAELIDARDGQNLPVRTTAQGESPSAVPATFGLDQNYPNPFNPSTSIRIALAGRELTTVDLYDVLGRHVATLLQEIRDPGVYTLTWNAAGFPSGVYLCRVTAGAFTATRRMLLVK